MKEIKIVLFCVLSATLTACGLWDSTPKPTGDTTVTEQHSESAQTGGPVHIPIEKETPSPDATTAQGAKTDAKTAEVDKTVKKPPVETMDAKTITPAPAADDAGKTQGTTPAMQHSGVFTSFPTTAEALAEQNEDPKTPWVRPAGPVIETTATSAGEAAKTADADATPTDDAAQKTADTDATSADDAAQKTTDANATSTDDAAQTADADAIPTDDAAQKTTDADATPTDDATQTADADVTPTDDAAQTADAESDETPEHPAYGTFTAADTTGTTTPATEMAQTTEPDTEDTDQEMITGEQVCNFKDNYLKGGLHFAGPNIIISGSIVFQSSTSFSVVPKILLKHKNQESLFANIIDSLVSPGDFQQENTGDLEDNVLSFTYSYSEGDYSSWCTTAGESDSQESCDITVMYYGEEMIQTAVAAFKFKGPLFTNIYFNGRILDFTGCQ